MAPLGKPESSAPDELILRRFLAGDRAACRTLEVWAYEVVRSRRFGIASHEHKDLVQETMAGLWRACGRTSFVLRSNMRGLVHRIAAARCIDWRRRQRPLVPLDETFQDPGPLPEESAGQVSEMLRLSRALAGVDPSCRELIRLHFLEGFTYPEIASRVGKAEGALRVRMFHCMKAIRKLLMIALLLVLASTATAAVNPRATPARASAADSAVLDSARALLRAGRFTEAEVMARRRWQEAEAFRGAASPEAAEALDLLVEALWRNGRSDEAETLRLAQEAVARRERAARDSLALAKSLNNLGIIRSDRGEYDEAQAAYERALGLQEGALGLEHVIVARTMNNLGLLRFRVGDYEGALSLFERALAVREKLLGPEHPDVAISLVTLGSLLREMGDDPRARALLERALAIRERALGRDHPYVAAVLGQLGDLHTRAGELDLARGLYERALAIQEKALGVEHPSFAATLTSLGEVLGLLGEGQAARRALERAVALRERTHSADHPHVAESLSHLADLLWAQGDTAGARNHHERALAIREKALGPHHPLVAQSLVAIGGLDLATGDTAAALRAALRAEEIAREHVRLTARTLPERAALRYAAARARGLDLALSLAASGLHPDETRSVWDALIRSRALVFDEMARRQRSVGESEDSTIARLAERLAGARTRLANLVVRAPAGGAGEPYLLLLARAREEKERAERALAGRSLPFREEQRSGRIGLPQVVAALPERSALVAFIRFDRLVPAASTGKAAAARSHVGAIRTPQRPLDQVPFYAAFVLADSAGGGPDGTHPSSEPGDHSVARRIEPRFVPLGPAADIDSLVARFARETARGPTGPGRWGRGEAECLRLGAALRERVWDPVAIQLASVERVLVVPDGAIHLVNLASLPVGGWRYWVERGPLLHLLSTERDLARYAAPPRSASGVGLLVLADPDFGRGGEVASGPATGPRGRRRVESAAAPGGSVRPARAGCFDLQSLHFEPLPSTRDEVDEVVALYRRTAANGVVRLVGSGAGERAFKRHATTPRILHVATHGFFLPADCDPLLPANPGSGANGRGPPVPGGGIGENPLLLSGLALAGANRHPSASLDAEDGIITAEEIAGLEMRGAEWVVLSACQTGLGTLEVGEGVFGLRRAFEISGVRSVIMSLWAVEDASTRAWMRELYRARLGEGMSTADAVREAARRTLARRRRAGLSGHPLYWAGFVASGDWH